MLGLDSDVLTMFHEAQRNILELNKSRLQALDDLRQAKERIRELGAPPATTAAWLPAPVAYGPCEGSTLSAGACAGG
jgi:hypothetical protein